ncbi:MAG: hypothetical protein LQ343_004421 [Gyalolechia ehrenbergii]|nr:MAG: hypothetical protein LQ343_004421 [Gyalolechia ehrenbergii]
MPGQQEGKMNWDDTADKNLLLQIIAGQDVRVDYSLVAPVFGCSVSAVKQRVLKLKKEAKEAGFNLGAKPGDTSAGNETDGSPLKGKNAKGKGKAKKNNEDGDGEKAATPAKKPRGRKPKGDSETKPSPAKKQKKGNDGDVSTATPTKGKGKKDAKADKEASSAAATEGFATPYSSEATTVKMEGVDENPDRVTHNYTTSDGSGIVDKDEEGNAVEEEVVEEGLEEA